MKTKTAIVSCHTANSKSVKQEVIGTVILLHLVFPATAYLSFSVATKKKNVLTMAPEIGRVLGKRAIGGEPEPERKTTTRELLLKGKAQYG